MAKLFKKVPSVVDRLNLITRGTMRDFSSELDRLLAAGSSLYSQAVTRGYSTAIKRYMSNVSNIISDYRKSDRIQQWRNLTREYRRSKSPRNADGSAKAIGASAPNNYFKGFRNLQNDRGLSTHRKSRSKGQSLISFTKNLVGNPSSLGRLRKTFGGLERVVSGGVFKEGVTLRTRSRSGGILKTPVPELNGRRLTIREALSRERTYTAGGVIRGEGGRLYVGGKRYGIVEAAQLGLIGKKVSFSIASRLHKILAANKSVITSDPYGGIFTGQRRQYQKLAKLAKKGIDPFTDEAGKLMGTRVAGGYLHSEIQKEVQLAAQRTNNIKLKSPYGNAKVRIRP